MKKKNILEKLVSTVIKTLKKKIQIKSYLRPKKGFNKSKKSYHCKKPYFIYTTVVTVSDLRPVVGPKICVLTHNGS